MSIEQGHVVFTGEVWARRTHTDVFARLFNKNTNLKCSTDERGLFEELSCALYPEQTTVPDNFSSQNDYIWQHIFAMAAIQGYKKAHNITPTYPVVNDTLVNTYAEQFLLEAA